MKKKVIVISLGGSLIVPKDVDLDFLDKFRKVILRHSRKNKFVVVCGGGTVARRYIAMLKHQGKSLKEQSLAGIRATRMNAELLIQIFGSNANRELPKTMKDVENDLHKKDVVFCGALRYVDRETSDGTAAKLANYFSTELINLTNVDGLFSANPLTNRGAKFIPSISWNEFLRKALRIKFTPGQHFVLDQNAARTIKKFKIKTFILGKDLRNLDLVLRGREFLGTVIDG